jgi:hypothetical protein
MTKCQETKYAAPLREAPSTRINMSSMVEEDARGKRVAYKDVHTLYEAEQKRADRLSRDEVAKELGNEENFSWTTEQLKKALDP